MTGWNYFGWIETDLAGVANLLDVLSKADGDEDENGGNFGSFTAEDDFAADDFGVEAAVR